MPKASNEYFSLFHKTLYIKVLNSISSRQYIANKQCSTKYDANESPGRPTFARGNGLYLVHIILVSLDLWFISRHCDIFGMFRLLCTLHCLHSILSSYCLSLFAVGKWMLNTRSVLKIFHINILFYYYYFC